MQTSSTQSPGFVGNVNNSAQRVNDPAVQQTRNQDVQSRVEQPADNASNSVNNPVDPAAKGGAVDVQA